MYVVIFQIKQQKLDQPAVSVNIYRLFATNNRLLMKKYDDLTKQNKKDTAC